MHRTGMQYKVDFCFIAGMQKRMRETFFFNLFLYALKQMVKVQKYVALPGV